MEYRRIPRGNKIIGTVGLGCSGLLGLTEEEITGIYFRAVEAGINFFDLCDPYHLYRPMAKVLKGRRESIFLQYHFGAVYNEAGEYEWSRDLNRIKKTFEEGLKLLETDYVDFGFIHCIDDIADYEENIVQGGILEYMLECYKEGKIHHLGFSTHTPELANHLLDTGLFDLMMFSLNPPYDLEIYHSSHNIGSQNEREELYRRCEKEGVGISVMKPFFRGKLFSQATSPFNGTLSIAQCLKYCLDKPGVITTLPGVNNIKQLEELILAINATEEEKDYSILKTMEVKKVMGVCVYCEHCSPCPMGLKVGQINRDYDLALIQDVQAKSHYASLEKHASDCIGCGHCESRCPFKVKQSERMQKIADYFGY